MVLLLYKEKLDEVKIVSNLTLTSPCKGEE